MECDNTNCQDGKDIKQVEMRKEFEGGIFNWCYDCRERDRDMIADKAPKPTFDDETKEMMSEQIKEILQCHSEQVMFDGGESEYRFSDDEFDLVIESLTNLFTG